MRQRLTMMSLAIAKAFTSENLSVMISILESESSRLSISAMAKKPTLMGMRNFPAKSTLLNWMIRFPKNWKIRITARIDF